VGTDYFSGDLELMSALRPSEGGGAVIASKEVRLHQISK
jgi:hypothetical protein